MVEAKLSEAIEALLVQRNPRHMQVARAALQPGYYLRAARHLRDLSGTVIIATGFPVTGTFETDGPVGAIVLYNALQTLGARPVLACGPPLSGTLAQDYEVLELTAQDREQARDEAARWLAELSPEAIVAIERPGLAADGRYYNMRGDDISARCYCFDPFMELARCPTIGIGDGGNEIGMGNIAAELAALDIQVSVTRCDELLVADVSNWGAYGLLALLGRWARRDLLAGISPVEILNYLSTRGSVDGVTGRNTLTEDGMEARIGLNIIHALRTMTGGRDS
ncbi:MAG: hypothetical protein CME59_10475 [Halioglobus sp.]|nr:hypothetical protein [Halioglobus sp.]|tara:strand:+ start:459 stop:1301 length:843 start_codon:yes stop_codon:yes gene_type:complete